MSADRREDPTERRRGGSHALRGRPAATGRGAATGMTAYTAMTRAEGRLMLREPMLTFWACVFPVLLLGIFGLIPVFRTADPETGVRLIELYLPVLILLSICFIAVTGLPSILGTYRERKILKRLATTPAGWRRLIAAQLTLIGGVILVMAVVLLAVGRAAFAVPLPGNPAAYLLVLVLVTAAMLALGLLVGALTPSAKVASALGSMAFFPLMFFGGLWLPVQAMPEVLQTISGFTPLGAGSLALHEAATGQWPAALHLLVLAAYAAGLGWAAVRWFRWE
ncbi:MAG: ABC transporter permease [Intrasporangium sp.]|uniref:ABC transporter permease n=1 Tax=Intrasporangium sp. TaxID=1925024 RepID=UPI002647D81D|nr:ABC transporter permease [Intrasporangium sp.]MDN5797869.1 ABC transporter permease [Intrasporangium sp.]